MQRHIDFPFHPFHQACSSTSFTPQEMESCIQEHGIERATEVDDQQINSIAYSLRQSHVTKYAIRAYLTLAPEAANAQDGTGMTGLHILCPKELPLVIVSVSTSNWLQKLPMNTTRTK